MLHKMRRIFDKLRDCQFLSLVFRRYSALHGPRPVEDFEDLADGPSRRGEVARGGCLFVWNFNVTRSAVNSESLR